MTSHCYGYIEREREKKEQSLLEKKTVFKLYSVYGNFSSALKLYQFKNNVCYDIQTSPSMHRVNRIGSHSALIAAVQGEQLMAGRGSLKHEEFCCREFFHLPIKCYSWVIWKVICATSYNKTCKKNYMHCAVKRNICCRITKQPCSNRWPGAIYPLTHCGQVTPYGDTDQCQHWCR